MKKKLFSILLVAAMLCSLIVPSALAASTAGTVVSGDATGSKVTVSDKVGGGLTVTVTQSGTADNTVNYDFGVFSKSGDIATNYDTISKFLTEDNSQSLSDLVNNTSAPNIAGENVQISYAAGAFSKDIDLSAQDAGFYYVVAWVNGQTTGATGVEIEIDATGKIAQPLAISGETISGAWTVGTSLGTGGVLAATASGGTAPYTFAVDETDAAHVSDADLTAAGLALTKGTGDNANKVYLTGTPNEIAKLSGKTLTIKVTDNASATKTVAVTLPTVNKGTQTLSLSANPASVTVGQDVEVTVSGAQGTISIGTISDNTKATATLTGNTITVHGVAAGSATLTVDAAATANYDAAAQVTLTINVSAGATNTVDAGADKTVTYGDAKFTQTATGKGTITYASDATGVATVDPDSGEVTIVGQGTATITATAAGGTVDGTTYASGSDSYTLTVNKKALTIKFTGNEIGKTLDTVTYDLEGKVGTDDVKIADDGFEWTNLGTHPGENEGDPAVPNTPADVTIAAGDYTYTVTLDGAAKGNYTIVSPGTMTITAPSSGGFVSSDFTVTYAAGAHGTINGATSEKVKRNESPAKVPTVTANKGYAFIGWSLDGKTLVNPAAQTITKNTTFTALYGDHLAYMVGRSATEFVPNGNLTRAEAAAILSRLTEGFEEDGTYPAAPYSDLTAGAWYVKYVNFAADKGIVNGRDNGTFDPDANITRAEFATMIANFAKIAKVDTAAVSTDVAGHWAEGYIAALEQAKVVTGYEDGTFKPNANITRAEAATMVNGAIGRVPMSELDLAANGYVNPFVDVTTSQWFYAQVMEAGISHMSSHFHK